MKEKADQKRIYKKEIEFLWEGERESQRLRGKKELNEKTKLLRGKTWRERDMWKAERSPEKA